MSSVNANNQRIAKNAMMLYLRMFLTMGVSLYTSRVILVALGVEDFGIYTIVGGVVALFSFVESSMTSATQRFLNYEMGSGVEEKVKRMFSASLTSHLLIAVVLFLLLETLGVWFLETKINIPTERVFAAKVVYQFSVLTCCVQVVRVPYHASIIAYEKMSFYAYVSILEVFLKLGAMYVLLISAQDKLILYAALMFTLVLLVFGFYYWYCKRNFRTCDFVLCKDRGLLKKLFGFSGWSMFGSFANVGANQGISVLLNVFFGVTLNAAMGISNQVASAVYSFVNSFQTAFNPQIVKSYSAGNFEYFTSLVFRSSRFSYYLLFVLALPIILYCQNLLDIWLVETPPYAVPFVQLFLVSLLIDAMSAPFWISVQATGKIRNYQLLVAGIIVLNLPITYLLFRNGFSPEWAVVVRIGINLITHIARVVYLSTQVDIPLIVYLKDVLYLCLPATIISFVVSYLLRNESIIEPLFLLFYLILTALGSVATIFLIGLYASERNLILSEIKKRIKW